MIVKEKEKKKHKEKLKKRRDQVHGLKRGTSSPAECTGKRNRDEEGQEEGRESDGVVEVSTESPPELRIVLETSLHHRP